MYKGRDVMGLKSVEMQVAIPRSQDAGKMQDQLSRQGQQFQETLAQQKLREEHLQRQRVQKHEKVVKQGDAEKENQSEQQSETQKRKDDASKPKAECTHPYLGKQVDFTR